MAINTGGFRLSQMPRTDVDFTVQPIDLSGLGRGLSSFGQQMGEQKRVRAEKERQGNIRLAAFGDKEAMESLSDADKGYVEEMKEKIEADRKRLRISEMLADAQAAASRSTTATRNFERGVKETAPKIRVTPDGTALPSRAAQLAPPNVISAARDEAKRLRLSDDLNRATLAGRQIDVEKGQRNAVVESLVPLIKWENDVVSNPEIFEGLDESVVEEASKRSKIENNKVKLSDLSVAGTEVSLTKAQREEQEALEASSVDEAFDLWEAGIATQEQFKDEPWAYKLDKRIKFKEFDDQYEIQEKGPFTILYDKLNRKVVDRRTATERELLLRSVPEELRDAMNERLVKSYGAERPVKIEVAGEEYTGTPEQADAQERFRLMLQGKDTRWKIPVIGQNRLTLSDAMTNKQKEAAELKFFEIVKKTDPKMLRNMDLSISKLIDDPYATQRILRDKKGNPILDKDGNIQADTAEDAKSVAELFDSYYNNSSDFFIDIYSKPEK